MSEFSIETVECRRFDSSEFATPIELEFHRSPRWAESMQRGRISNETVAGDALTRLAARTALTGSMLPPLSIFRGPGEPVSLDHIDVFSLSLEIAKFGPVPTTEDYTPGSGYLELRSVVERSLGIQHIRLGLRGGERWSQVEERVELLSKQLGAYSVALSGSPTLELQKFAQLISKNQKIFAFANAENTLLGATAVGSAYQVVVVGDPVLAVQLAMGGASCYVVLKFGAAVGKTMERIVGR
jgi:hypothetical protein